jgi:hypothetical protein
MYLAIQTNEKAKCPKRPDGYSYRWLERLLARKVCRNPEERNDEYYKRPQGYDYCWPERALCVSRNPDVRNDGHRNRP